MARTVPEAPTAFFPTCARGSAPGPVPVPAAPPVSARRQLLPALITPSAKAGASDGDAPHVETFHVGRGASPSADDQFGAATADVHHQSPRVRLRQEHLRHAEIDQTRLFDAGDGFDRMAERLLGLGQKLSDIVGTARRVLVPTTRTVPLPACGPRAHRNFRRQLEGARLRVASASRSPVLVQSRGELHHLPQAIDDHRSSPSSVRATSMWKLLEPRSTRCDGSRVEPWSEARHEACRIMKDLGTEY